jgi:hypothetical protein
MSYLVRPRGWYLGWMSIYGAEESAESGNRSREEEKLEQRSKEALDLKNTIAQRQFRNETFETLAQVLDHEGFHLSVQKRRNSNGSPSRGLQIEATSSIVRELLSEGLFTAITPETPYQRELQLRAVLSGLVLQQAQVAEAVQAEHHDHRRNQLKKAHRDLQNQRPPSGEFTRAVFREYQSSFLVVAISEYANKTFIRAEPLAATLFRAVINAIAAGVLLAVASTTVSFSPQISNHTLTFDIRAWARPACLMRFSALMKASSSWAHDPTNTRRTSSRFKDSQGGRSHSACTRK